MQKTYSYEPVPAGLPASQVHHILGVQGNLWTEYVPNTPWAEYLLWPREAAVAEVGWSPAAGRTWDDFAARLPAEQARLDAMNVNYRPIADDGLTHAIHLDGGKLVIDPVPGTTIHYDLSGDFPSAQSPTYAGPVDLPGGWVQASARYFRPGTVATEATAATFLDGRPVVVTATSPKDWDARQTAFYTVRYGGGSDDTVTVTFTEGPQPLHAITVVTGDEGHTDTVVKHAVLETSGDGKAFDPVAKFDGKPSVHADLPGKPVAAFRIRFTAMQLPHPIIKSVEVE